MSIQPGYLTGFYTLVENNEFIKGNYKNKSVDISII